MNTPKRYIVIASCRTEFTTTVIAGNAKDAALLAQHVATEGWEWLGHEHTTVRPIEVKEICEEGSDTVEDITDL